MTGMPQSLARLKVDDAEEFNRDIQQLDALPVRTADTVSLFYVKRGQAKLADMLANVVSFKCRRLVLKLRKKCQILTGLLID